MNDGPIANSLLDEAQIQRASTIPVVRFPERAFDLDHLEDAETHLSYAFKRGFDCLFSLTVIILGAPFFGLIALLVKLTSPGPVFFVQERLGKGGKPFQFYKFRTMHHMSDDSIHRSYSTNFINGMGNGGAESPNPNIFKLTQDPRVTLIGRLLRRTSLDELPQFLNILRGEMSLVGPRPPVWYELEHYQEWHMDRLTVRPGLTGLWQVSKRSTVPFDEMVRLDLEYIDSWSLMLDLKIILRTLPVMCSGSGAY